MHHKLSKQTHEFVEVAATDFKLHKKVTESWTAVKLQSSQSLIIWNKSMVALTVLSNLRSKMET
jgi:hypothetical protein